MIVHQHIYPLRSWLQDRRTEGKTIGFVPTMGALHQGHLKLMETSLYHSDITVCSIFVNPTQFNDPADFKKYPIRTGADLDMLFAAGVQLVFIPTAEEIYPSGLVREYYELDGLDSKLEGKFRPGHFQGVCQVMDRLLSIVDPDHLYMGQKDFQQCLVIQKLIEIRQFRAQLEIFPTVREQSGLAMSSRNLRLNEEQLKKSPLIFEVLSDLKNTLNPGELEPIRSAAEQKLTANGFVVDYVVICEPVNLEPVYVWDGAQKLVALVAAFLGEVRLIDNLQIS